MLDIEFRMIQWFLGFSCDVLFVGEAASLNNSSTGTKASDWLRSQPRSSSRMRAGSQANKVRLWRARGVTERACTRDKKGGALVVGGEEIIARRVYKLSVYAAIKNSLFLSLVTDDILIWKWDQLTWMLFFRHKLLFIKLIFFIP